MALSTSELIKIGLLQGFPLVMFVGLYHVVRSYWKKYQQKKHIREIVSSYLEKIQNAEDFCDSEDPEKVLITADQLRKIYCNSMYKDLDFFLNYKTTELSYEDEKEIRDAFYFVQFMEEHNGLPSLEIYKTSLIKTLKEIKWLELDKPSNPHPIWASNR